MVESEKSESGVSESVPAKATKAKASSAQCKVFIRTDCMHRIR